MRWQSIIAAFLLLVIALASIGADFNTNRFPESTDDLQPGELVVIGFNKGGAGVTGFPKTDGGTNADTTSDAEVGYYVPDDMYLVRVVLTCSDGAAGVPDDTTQFFGDQTEVLRLVKTVSFFDTLLASPPTFTGGTTIAPFIVAGSSGNPTPNDYQVWLYLRKK